MTSFFSEPAIRIATGDSPGFVLIWLHGLGADGSDFVPVIEELGLPPDLPGHFIFPHAPWRRVTCNGGYEMRAWYDILSLQTTAREINSAHLQAACSAVQDLIEAEIAGGIPAERIFLAGFSQGGAVAYAAGLNSPRRLGGIVALSTYIASEAALAGACRDDVPLFAAHGSDDDVVAPALGRRAYAFARSQGIAVAEWHEYPMAHQVCLEEIRELGGWLVQRLLPEPAIGG